MSIFAVPPLYTKMPLRRNSNHADGGDNDGHEWPDVEPSAFLKCYGFGLRTEHGTWPKLEITVDGHDEESGHTWYKLECAIVQPGMSRSEWQTKKRLTHLRDGLHDQIKRELGDTKYAEYFADTPFAKRGGMKGTTARLIRWFSTLANRISTGQVSLQVTALVLRFIDAPYVHTTVMSCLDDQDSDVKCAAVQMLLKTSQVGTEEGITMLISHLERGDNKVRQAVVDVLFKVTTAGDESVITALASLLDFQSEFDVVLDCSSGEKLGVDVVHQPGGVMIEAINEGAVEAWNSGRQDKRVQVGDHFVEVNGVRGDAVKLISLFNQHAQLRIKVRRPVDTSNPFSEDLHEPDEQVSMAAMLTLAKVARIGDEIATGSIISYLHHQNRNVRLTAVKTLPEVAEKGDERVIAALKACLDDEFDQVRGEVANGLAMLEVAKVSSAPLWA